MLNFEETSPPLMFFPSGAHPVEAIICGWQKMASGEIAAVVRHPERGSTQLYCRDRLTGTLYPLLSIAA